MIKTIRQAAADFYYFMQYTMKHPSEKDEVLAESPVAGCANTGKIVTFPMIWMVGWMYRCVPSATFPRPTIHSPIATIW